MKRILNNLFVGLVAIFAALSLTYTVAAGLATTHTAFSKPDAQTDFGLFAAVENLNTAVQTNMLNKTIVANNAASSVTLSSGYNIYMGTNYASQVITIPAGVDSQQIGFYTQGAIASAVAWVSSGASVVGGPATMAANTSVRFMYDAATTSWYPIGH